MNTKSATITIRTTDDVKQAIELVAKNTGTTVTEVILRAVLNTYGQESEAEKLNRRFAEAGRRRERISFE